MIRWHVRNMLMAAVLLTPMLGGCITNKGNVGELDIYAVPRQEAEWIRNGEPIEFEGARWYPQDSFDILLDSEVIKAGEYNGVEFFTDRADVRPFNRLYTKFSRNKFRFFVKKQP